MQGTLIVIEGTDGSGKSTQFELLAKRLAEEGYAVKTVKFPRYGQPSSYFIQEYLNGKYGSADEVGPYTGSLFYALDRYAAATELRQALEAGKVVLVDRYTGSNMAHQGTKFRHAAERRGFFIWLDNLEFELLKIPRPTISIVLRVPPETAWELAGSQRQRSYTDQQRDVHESDRQHLEQAIQVYDDMCQLFPKDFTSIDCSREGKLLPVEAIHDILHQKVQPYLPEKKPGQAGLEIPEPAAQSMPAAPAASSKTAPSQQSTSYFTPDSLPEHLKVQYRSHLDRILELHREVTAKLTEYLKVTSNDAENEARAIAQSMLPIASQISGDGHLSRIIGQAAARPSKALNILPASHANQAKPSIQLTDIRPRNELDALADIIYPYSTQPLKELRAKTTAWKYEDKAAMLEACAVEQPEALDAIQYAWDIVSNARTLAAFAERLQDGLSCQGLTPRYGYAVPELLDPAGLSDQFEACFDISLGLYSLLQEAGLQTEAQYAVLLGHIARWKVTLRASDFIRLYKTVPGNPLLGAMRDQLAEAHPITISSLGKARPAIY